MSTRIDIITMGCSKNLVDSEFLSKQLEANGYFLVHDAIKPLGKIIVINTCGFIGDAKEESIEMILHFAKEKKIGRINKLFVMGCLSERYLAELGKEIPEVDKFYGKFNYTELIKDLGKNFRSDLRLERSITTQHYAYVKISEGCNRTCSYCAIPIITGKHKSRTIEDIIEETSILARKGIKEIQLIAQDLSYYGKDLYHSSRLGELVNRMADINGIEWIRLHYTYPNQFPLDILDVIKNRPNVCHYLDIALQHTSNHMLNQMRRNISKEEQITLLNKIREKIPDIHLRTTLMVGHPGETEEDFAELLDFVNTQRFERMGAFAYSHEEGTYSYLHYKDEIPYSIKQERLNSLMLLQQEISNEINANKVGKCYKVIIDKETDNYYIGRTEYDSPEVDCEVMIDKSAALHIGNFYNIKITDSTEFELFGKLDTNE